MIVWVGNFNEYLYVDVPHKYIILFNNIFQMIEKYQAGDFGHCPRVYCENQPMLPIGLSDVPGEAMVKLYCPKCMDVYTPKSSRHHHTGKLISYLSLLLVDMLFILHLQWQLE